MLHLFHPAVGSHPNYRLSNEKPSAIFRLRGTFSSSTSYAAFDTMNAFAQTPSTSSDVTAMLGISIEPLHQIQPQIDALHSSTTAIAKPVLAQNPALLAERIVRHLFNFISSYSGSAAGSQTMVPMSLIAKWYENFTTRVKTAGTGFLEREE